MLIILIILAVAAVVAVAYIALNPPSAPIGLGSDFKGSTFAPVGGSGGFAPWEIHKLGENKIFLGANSPTFTHGMQSTLACSWLVTFIRSAGASKIFTLDAVKDAIGQGDGGASALFDFEKQLVAAIAPAATVAVSAIGSGVLATSSIVMAPVAAVASLISALAGLDSEIKRRVQEAVACAAFMNWYVDKYGLPPMAVLNALNAYVPEAPEYGLFEGSGTAMDRSKEWGPGAIASLWKLFYRLKKDKKLHGIPFIARPDSYLDFVRTRKLSMPLYNNQAHLKPSRLSPRWIRYCLHTSWLFDRPILRWKGNDCAKHYREALAETRKRTGNPFIFDQRTMIDWLTRGEVYKGLFRGLIQPSLVPFELGHDPSLNDYRGALFETSGAKPRIGKSSWRVIADTWTDKGWIYVSPK